MSAYDPTLALTVPGRFVVGPNQAGLSTGQYPFNGLPLGICSKTKLVREQSYAYANSEALGRDGVSAYAGKFKASLVSVLVQFDKTLLNALFASNSVSAGGYAGANRLSLPLPGRNVVPGFVPAGAISTNGHSSLLFVPDDYLNLPAVIVYAPIYVLAAKLELDLVLNNPLETAFVALVGLDATNRDLECDLIGNLAA